MFRWVVLSVCLIVFPTLAQADAKPVAVAYSVHSGYFERNDSGLKGSASYLVIEDRSSFDKLFGVAFTMGPKPKVLPENAFESKRVVAVIKRGGEVWDYKVESIVLENGVLTVRYTAQSHDGGGAQFASPLIVSIPKEPFRQVVFIEGGKQVGTVQQKAQTN